MRVFSETPKPLILASALFFLAAYFAARFPDVPGASAGSYVSTFAIAAPSFVALTLYFGVRKGLFALVVLGVFGYCIETVGVVTGFPYGEFFYGDSLGGKLFGVVPYLLPVSYVPLVIGAVAASWRPRGSRPLFILRAALLLTLFDVVLDPGAVALGFWVWPDGGVYYGVPLCNYFGWLISSAFAAALLTAFDEWRFAPLPGLLDGAIVGLSFWIGVSAFTGMLFPTLFGLALFAFLLRKRSSLRQDKLKP
ncbi:MAG: carotenoid biosynthesis protein [Rubrobacteraceae bacterium]